MKKKAGIVLLSIMLIVFGFLFGFFAEDIFLQVDFNKGKYYQTGKNIALVDGNWEQNFYYRMSQGNGIDVDVLYVDNIVIRDRNNERTFYFVDGFKLEHNQMTETKTKLEALEAEHEDYFTMIKDFKEEVQFIMRNENLFEMTGYMFEKSIPTIELNINSENCKNIDFLTGVDSAKIRMSFNGSFYKVEFEKKILNKTIGQVFAFFTSQPHNYLLPNDLDNYVTVTMKCHRFSYKNIASVKWD